VLEAFYEHQVAVLQALQQVLERRLRGAAKLVHQRPARAAQEQHLVTAGLAQALRILARAIDLDVLVAVLDERHDEPRALSAGTSRASSVVLPMPE
jgi:hypothetical protein